MLVEDPGETTCGKPAVVRNYNPVPTLGPRRPAGLPPPPTACEEVMFAMTPFDPQHDVKPLEEDCTGDQGGGAPRSIVNGRCSANLEANNQVQPKWRSRLAKELELGGRFIGWSSSEWRSYLASKKLLSVNYDTIVSLDWPHFCGDATEGCGGARGWCYTLGGQLGGADARSIKAAVSDRLARDFPDLFADVVVNEVHELVDGGALPYPNLRVSGSGEAHIAHVPALARVKDRGVQLWGFSKSIKIALEMRKIGASIMFSCDATTPRSKLDEAIKNGFALAYTSIGAGDHPPVGTTVTFPLHRSGRVREVVDTPTVCPKVVEEFFNGKRRQAACQSLCRRCHSVR